MLLAVQLFSLAMFPIHFVVGLLARCVILHALAVQSSCQPPAVLEAVRTQPV